MPVKSYPFNGTRFKPFFFLLILFFAHCIFFCTSFIFMYILGWRSKKINIPIFFVVFNIHPYVCTHGKSGYFSFFWGFFDILFILRFVHLLKYLLFCFIFSCLFYVVVVVIIITQILKNTDILIQFANTLYLKTKSCIHEIGSFLYISF